MHELTLPLTDEDKGLIGSQLEKLFVFQDRPMSDRKKAMFVEELANTGLPVDAILQGIQSLRAQDLSSIKFSTIREAAREFLTHDDRVTPCVNCNRTGLIIMRDTKGRDFSLACRCPNGERWRRDGMKMWEGEITQWLSHPSSMDGERNVTNDVCTLLER